MPRLNDTTPEAERVLRAIYRNMPLSRRWQQMEDTYRTARALHAAGVRARQPAASAAEIRADWVRSVLGTRLGSQGQGCSMESHAEQGRVVEEVMAVLHRLGVPHALGGSW